MCLPIYQKKLGVYIPIPHFHLYIIIENLECVYICTYILEENDCEFEPPPPPKEMGNLMQFFISKNYMCIPTYSKKMTDLVNW